MKNIEVIYPTKPEYATDTRGNKYPLLYTEESNMYPILEERVLEIFKKYNINIDYKDDDTFSDWLWTSYMEGLFANWTFSDFKTVILLQWMTDVRAQSPNITYVVVKEHFFGQKINNKK